MDLKSKIGSILKQHYGDFNTYLEVEYENKLTENLIKGDHDHKTAWATYNQVILELKFTLKDMLRVKELQYKLTDTSNHNEACIDVMEAVKDNTPELNRLYNKIKNL